MPSSGPAMRTICQFQPCILPGRPFQFSHGLSSHRQRLRESGIGALKPSNVRGVLESEKSNEVISDAKKVAETGKDSDIAWEEVRKDPRMTEVYDQLIQLFQSKQRGQWGKLLAISSNWAFISDGVFSRIDVYTEEESDPGKKLEWISFKKALYNVHTEITRYDEILVEFLSTKSYEWDAIVTANRKYMTPGFFDHLANLIAAGKDDPAEQTRLKEISSSALTLVEMYDQGGSDQKALEMAKDSLLDILKSDSLEEADQRMDQLAATGGLDGAMMLTVANMYTSVKESDYVKDEVKEVMLHLYLKSKESLESQQPPAVRILKYLLTLEDPSHLRKALDDAFTPGELPSADLDYLYTRPSDLLKVIDSVLTTFEQQKGKHTKLGQASNMLNPEVIQKLRKLEVYVRKEYM